MFLSRERGRHEAATPPIARGGGPRPSWPPMLEAADTRLLLFRPKRIEGLPPLAATLLLGIAALAFGAAAAVVRMPVSPVDCLLFVALAAPATLTQFFATFK